MKLVGTETVTGDTDKKKRRHETESSELVDRHLGRGAVKPTHKHLLVFYFNVNSLSFSKIKHSIISTYDSRAFQKQLNSKVCIQKLKMELKSAISTIHITYASKHLPSS